MDALGVMLEEHGIILMTINVLNDAAEKLQAGGKLPPEFFEKALYIIRNFADKCHHGKEETVLFPLFNKPGKPASRIIVSFLEDHEKGRAFVRALSEAVARKDNGGIIKNAKGYAGLLPKHIKRENEIFPKWIGSLSEQTKEEVFEEFEKIEEEVIGLGKHHEYIRNIEGLKNSLGKK
jgi:hemerythrin-like domain-containing protein